MPVLPMDGGRVVESLLRKPGRAELVSVIAGIAIAAIAFRREAIVTGMIFLALVGENLTKTEIVRRLLLRISRSYS
jgi:Zn-dependent protease